MKKAMVALMLVLCATTLFAATHTQTIVLMSVVESVKPSFTMNVAYVENGYANKVNDSEVTIHSCNIKEDVTAQIDIYQSLARFTGAVEVSVTVSELTCNGYSTKGLRLAGNVFETKGRTGFSTVSENTIRFDLQYAGVVQESLAAQLFVEYNGDSNLPEGDYVSYVVMSYMAK